MNTQTTKKLHHMWKIVRPVRPVYLLIVFLLCLSLSVFALRANNQTMVELREAVYAADKANGDVEAALRALRSHVYGHMNTNLSSGANAVYPPLQLKYTYERLQDTAQEQARQANQQIYTEAQADCERRYPESYSGGPRVPCIRDYVAARGVQVQTVPDELYKFNFVSPTWSPDLAGWSILLTGVVGVLVIIRISLPIILKRQNVL